MPTDNLPANNSTDREDWSHVQETITMLYLAVCQIKSSLTESNRSMDQLTSSFTELASHSSEVSNRAQNLDNPAQWQDFKNEISNTAAEMQTKISEAITAFQFYDRISQRLDHVALSLEQTTDLMSHPEKIQEPEAWRGIQEEVKSSYSMEAERIMFEHIMRGASVKEALEIYNHHFEESDSLVLDDTDDEIELF
ncbi:MAG: hypothetical protein AseanaTS_24360 [Candidatus Pelagadaptatus aseana]|uniref:hypothetical protein n=1 Tax=Candidatus Pelagadaptatus aseana TaxID=3120508 RepID=UPI0039B2008A